MWPAQLHAPFNRDIAVNNEGGTDQRTIFNDNTEQTADAHHHCAQDGARNDMFLEMRPKKESSLDGRTNGTMLYSNRHPKASVRRLGVGT